MNRELTTKQIYRIIDICDRFVFHFGTDITFSSEEGGLCAILKNNFINFREIINIDLGTNDELYTKRIKELEIIFNNCRELNK